MLTGLSQLHQHHLRVRIHHYTLAPDQLDGCAATASYDASTAMMLRGIHADIFVYKAVTNINVSSQLLPSSIRA